MAIILCKCITLRKGNRMKLSEFDIFISYFGQFSNPNCNHWVYNLLSMGPPYQACTTFFESGPKIYPRYVWVVISSANMFNFIDVADPFVVSLFRQINYKHYSSAAAYPKEAFVFCGPDEISLQAGGCTCLLYTKLDVS